MAALAQRIFLLSLTTTAVLLPLLLLTPRIQKRYRAGTCYVLWLLLAARLLLPVELELPRPAVTVETPADTVVLTLPAPANRSGRPATPVRPTTPQPAPAQPPRRGLTLGELAGTVWLTGAGVFLAWNFVGYLLARRRLLRGAVRTPEDRALAENLAGEVDLSRSVPVLRGEEVTTPMTLGMLCPVILIPAELLEGEELTLVLHHELCHIRRRDLWYKALLLIVNGVHWFNPVVWWMCRAAGQNLEYCCDDAVVEGRDRAYRHRYGEVLLRRAAAGGRSPALSTRFGGGGEMKGRIMNLFADKKRGAVMLCLVLCAALFSGGMVACESAPAAERTPQGTVEPAPLVYEAWSDADLGISLTHIPEEWVGKYRVENHHEKQADFVEFYYEASGELLFVIQITDPSEWEDAQSTVGRAPMDARLLELGEWGGKVYLLGYPLAEEGKDPAYLALLAQVPEVAEGFHVQQSGESQVPNDSGAMLAQASRAIIGVDMPQVDYGSDSMVVFHDYWGLAVYDRTARSLVRVADTPSLGMNLIQGDQHTTVKVGTDGDTILLENLPGQDGVESQRWTYHIQEDCFTPGGPEGFTPAPVTLGTANDGLTSNFVRLEDRAMIYLAMPEENAGLLRELQLIEERPDGTRSAYPLFPDQEAAGWHWPVPDCYEIANSFGSRVHPLTGERTDHTGTDISAPAGTEVLAARDGAVTESGFDETLGNYVLLSHDGDRSTLYGQLSQVWVKQGDKVLSGQAVGLTGNTGASTGPHLHLEYRSQGVLEDPLALFPDLPFVYGTIQDGAGEGKAFLETWGLSGLVPADLEMTEENWGGVIQYFEQFGDVEREYVMLLLRTISKGQMTPANPYCDLEHGVYLTSCQYCLYDMDRDGAPEFLLKTGASEADFWYTVYTIADGALMDCGGLSGSHAELYADGSGGFVRYMGQMGVYDLTVSTLEGTTLVTQKIANGTLDQSEDYPELKEYGYGAYDQPLEFHSIPTLFLAPAG